MDSDNATIPAAGCSLPDGSGEPAAVVALKSLELAKSRFTGHHPAVRRRLALCMLADTVEALASVMSRVVVVTSAPAIAAMVGIPQADMVGIPRADMVGTTQLEVLADPGRDVNAAFTAGAEYLRRHGFSPLVASVGDLPGLRPESVREILDRAAIPGRYFVRDHRGTGTTMLIAHAELHPLFEGGSARRHVESGAREIQAPQQARTDVDSEDDLATAAAAFALGRRTQTMLDGTQLADHDVATVSQAATAEGATVAISARGHRLVIPASAIDDMISHLAIGQRIHVQRRGMQVLSAWI